jgi:hypothetical protein
VNHWNHRVIGPYGFANRSKTKVFPVIFPVNRDLETGSQQTASTTKKSFTPAAAFNKIEVQIT